MARSMIEVVEQARQDLCKLTGLKLSSTVEVLKRDQGWRVCIEMVETSSILGRMDILALYGVDTDLDGNLLSFEREAMRNRKDIASSK
jgi:hypothetical protein